MKTIWKYELKPDCIIAMPIGSRILTIQTQNDIPYIWIFCDSEKPIEHRHFKCYGTGSNIEDVQDILENNRFDFPYIGTFQLVKENLVFHVFKL